VTNSFGEDDTGERRRRESDATYTRRRLLVAGAAAAVPLAIWARVAAGSSSETTNSPTSTTEPGFSGPSTAPSSTIEVVPSAAASNLGPITQDLQLGMVSDDVTQLQKRLTELKFDPGPIDGFFGQSTLRSAWAFQKLVLRTPRTEASGVITPTEWDVLRGSVTIQPRRSTNGQANATEIYLPEQVLAVFHNDQTVLVSHIASGKLDENGEPDEWCELVTIDTDETGTPLEEPVERDICGRSKTPGGVFEFTRRVEGIRNGALGSMWNPVYFNFGIAIHGAINVPAEPTSHGCVRLPMHIADYFQDLVTNGDRVLVWNGETPPEQVTEKEMLPVFDYANPDATTTTTSTTPTTTTTVPQPTTTAPPATTTPPLTTNPTTTTTTIPATTTTTSLPATTVPPNG
jgi:lipoprotein-anchoring transpeptidase ErfK/SrfK